MTKMLTDSETSRGTCSDRRRQQWNHPTRCTNKLGVKGVNWSPNHNLFRMRIRVEGKRIYKYFRTLEEAEKAYQDLATEHFGEFARWGPKKSGSPSKERPA